MAQRSGNFAFEWLWSHCFTVHSVRWQQSCFLFTSKGEFLFLAWLSSPNCSCTDFCVEFNQLSGCCRRQHCFYYRVTRDSEVALFLAGTCLLFKRWLCDRSLLGDSFIMSVISKCRWILGANALFLFFFSEEFCRSWLSFEISFYHFWKQLRYLKTFLAFKKILVSNQYENNRWEFWWNQM